MHRFFLQLMNTWEINNNLTKENSLKLHYSPSLYILSFRYIRNYKYFLFFRKEKDLDLDSNFSQHNYLNKVYVMRQFLVCIYFYANPDPGLTKIILKISNL